MTICNNCVGGIDRNRQICSVCNGTPEMPDTPAEEPSFAAKVKKAVKKK